MEPLFPSPVPTWHNDTYPAIHPINPNLSQKGKTVIITGAVSFAHAGAKHIAIMGRTFSALEETSSQIKKTSSITTTSIFPFSVTDEAATNDLAHRVGAWDTNVKSIYIAARAFLPTASPSASLLSVSAAGAFFPAPVGAGLAGYMTSKIAAAKLVEYLAHEHPSLFICSVHPGVVEMKMMREAGLDVFKVPKDTVELPAHFMLWLSGAGEGEKGWLRGRVAWCNWDVGELVEMRGKAGREDLCTVGLVGSPFEARGKDR
ncbi:NAD(P)-binding protein [Bimuria novae-zelandiae CBS 107.79]|uniref:NAD(P)-binding protein n=1 Tax=Bimuria novae-zelandiae CBS 107.79 TaxID=1447943 RepID=A0A6A5V729_9PLEO|nr:NAD(P)-binding protein [Bimuria novae-zelandiae CBS 107.79]